VAVLAEHYHAAQEGGKTAVTCVSDGWGAFCELGKNRPGRGQPSRMNGVLFGSLNGKWSRAEPVV